METKLYRVIVPILAVALCAMIWMFYKQRGETAKVEKRLHEICRFTKAALENTSRAIRSNTPGKNQDIRLVHGHGELTNQFVLGACAPTFQRDAWNACVDTNDEGCMLKMLEAAAKSIPSEP